MRKFRIKEKKNYQKRMSSQRQGCHVFCEVKCDYLQPSRSFRWRAPLKLEGELELPHRSSPLTYSNADICFALLGLFSDLMESFPAYFIFWHGGSFQDLNSLDFTEMPFLFGFITLSVPRSGIRVLNDEPTDVSINGLLDRPYLGPNIRLALQCLRSRKGMMKWTGFFTQQKK